MVWVGYVNSKLEYVGCGVLQKNTYTHETKQKNQICRNHVVKKKMHNQRL
jgi:hypothetical protein